MEGLSERGLRGTWSLPEGFLAHSPVRLRKWHLGQCLESECVSKW